MTQPKDNDIAAALDELDRIASALLQIKPSLRLAYLDEAAVPMSLVKAHTSQHSDQFPAAAMSEVLTELEHRFDQLFRLRSRSGQSDEQISRWALQQTNAVRSYLSMDSQRGDNDGEQ